jgi:hypothetical protein
LKIYDFVGETQSLLLQFPILAKGCPLRSPHPLASPLSISTFLDIKDFNKNITGGLKEHRDWR